MIQATLNEPVPLQLLASDGSVDLYGQVRIYDIAGTLLTSIGLGYLIEGIYSATWTPAIEGYFTVIYEFYSDSELTIPAPYDKQAEMVEVNSNKTNILRVLGLQKENSVFDQQVYDTNNRVTSARIRCYDSASNALLAGDDGLKFVYSVQAEYTGKILYRYSLIREQ